LHLKLVVSLSQDVKYGAHDVSAVAFVVGAGENSSGELGRREEWHPPFLRDAE
jgi:hypothetical protein